MALNVLIPVLMHAHSLDISLSIQFNSIQALASWPPIFSSGTAPSVQFSAANLALAGFPLTNALGENLPSPL